VVSVRIPLADRVYDAVDGGLRCRDQLSHLDSPSRYDRTEARISSFAAESVLPNRA
jgi:hypothetical protein